MKNQSIAAKLLGKNNPSTTTKRRLRAIRFPAVRHLADVVRSGSDHQRQQKVATTCFRFTVQLCDRGSLRVEFGAGEAVPAISVMDLAFQSTRLIAGAFEPNLALTEAAQQVLGLAVSEHLPEVDLTESATQETSLTDGAFQPP